MRFSNQGLIDLSKDESLWAKDLSTVPSMIYFEYEELKRMVEYGQFSRVLQQCIDSYTILLKVPVIMALIIIESESKHKEGSGYAEVIEAFLGNQMDIVNWANLARVIIANNNTMLLLPENLKAILIKTLNFYNTKINESILNFEDEDEEDKLYSAGDDNKLFDTIINDNILHSLSWCKYDGACNGKGIRSLFILLKEYFNGSQDFSINDLYSSCYFQCGEYLLVSNHYERNFKNCNVLLHITTKTFPVVNKINGYDLKECLFGKFYSRKNIYNYNATYNATQINYIKALLEDYRIIVNILKNVKLNDYSIIVISGSRICSVLLTLLLEQNGYEVVGDMVKVENNKRIRRYPVLLFCVEDIDILPNECRRFIHLINDFRNRSIHVGGFSFEAVIEFSKVLDYFMLWFKEHFVTRANISYERKKKLTDAFFLLEKELELDKLYTEKASAEDEYQKKVGIHMDLLQQIIQGVGEKILQEIGEVKEGNKRIECKVNKISEQIQKFSGQILSYQALVKRQIDKADSDSEKERLISAYTEECAERIKEIVNKQTEEVELRQEKEKLIASLDINAWNKLEELSQSFLISAKVMYNHLILLNDVVDYSGVCVLVTKALEVELAKRFYSNFIKYLESKYQNDYSKYPTSLLFKGRELLSPEKYTMGSVAFTLCYLSSQYDSPEQKFNNRNKLLEYAQECLFSSSSQKEIQNLLRKYAQSIENIRKKYRNPSAHTNRIKQTDAKECFDLVLDVEQLLKQMLDSFDS